MRLTEWCEKTGVGLAEAGRQLGVERRQTMWKYATGKVAAPPWLIVNAETLTEGKVRAADWIFESGEKAA